MRSLLNVTRSKIEGQGGESHKRAGDGCGDSFDPVFKKSL